MEQNLGNEFTLMKDRAMDKIISHMDIHETYNNDTDD